MKLAVSSPKVCSLTEAVLKHLQGKGMELVHFGALAGRPSDYIAAAEELAETVSSGGCGLGVLFCHTGTGATLIANKFPGVRAGVCLTEEMAALSRRHNDANILVLPGRLIGVDEALRIVRSWLETPFEGGRHQRRLDKIAALESRLKK